MVKAKLYDSVKSMVDVGMDLDYAIQKVVGTDKLDIFKEALSEDQVRGLNLNKAQVIKPTTITDQRSHIDQSIRLRKLTLKSKMDTGRYENWTVAEILEKNESYIPWCYYNLEKISFVDEVMEKLPHWVIENPIQKPGCDRDLWLILKETHFEKRRSYKDLSLLQLRNLLTYYKMNGKPTPDALYQAWKSKKVAIERSDKDDTPSKSVLRNKNQHK